MTRQVCDNGVMRNATPEEEAEIAARVPVIEVPRFVTRRQGLQKLRIEGITEAMIEANILAMPITTLEKDLALIEFSTSQVFERERALTIAMGGMIGLDSAGIDAWFIAADLL